MTTETAKQTIRILIAEDHQLTRQGLIYSLQKDGRFSVVGEVDNGEKAVKATQEFTPDVILMDIGMPVMNGISASQVIKEQFPDLKIIILTSHNEEEQVLAAFGAGADAYCMKDIDIDRLMHIIELVNEGGTWMDSDVAKIVMDTLNCCAENMGGLPAKDTTSGLNRKRYNTDLTDREYDVLEQIVAGKSNKEIALALDISLHTVKAHVGNIMQKLAVDDRTQAAIKALKEGLV